MTIINVQICKNLAIHHALFEGCVRSKEWSVTHIKTGLMVLPLCYARKANVIEVIKILDPLFDDKPDDDQSPEYAEWKARVLPEILKWYDWLARQ